MKRGYFEIGIVNGKFPENVGTLWRSAFQMGAAGIFTVGKRYAIQGTDTAKAHLSLPYREYPEEDTFFQMVPLKCPVIAIETGGRVLTNYVHPERAIYLLGSEDGGISKAILDRCDGVISLPYSRMPSYNVAVAGALVMFDRQTKRGEW